MNLAPKRRKMFRVYESLCNTLSGTLKPEKNFLQATLNLELHRLFLTGMQYLRKFAKPD
ncbi:hypothetical protein [Methanosarcina sp.]|uniref:hypothetical protein n=1 Tax=Methanosarcina sp. TaxID=2213 RepID=UPI003C7307F6